MALRDYLYAKHCDTVTVGRINKVGAQTDVKLINHKQMQTSFPTTSAPCSDLEDGKTECRKCPNCPKNATDAMPQVAVEVGVNEINTRLDQVDLAAREVDFTHAM